MENKELILKAIDNYSPYKKTRRDIFKILVNQSIAGIVSVNPGEIAGLLKLTDQAILQNLKCIEKDLFIERLPQRVIRYYSYRIREEKIESLLRSYLQKEEQKEMLTKIF